jgi:hypothetical protein
MTRTIAMTISFGTNVNVISFIEVADWKIDMISPTIADAIKIGAETRKAVKNASLAR